MLSLILYHSRAAKHGNTAANIKLGVAYLYNEGCKLYGNLYINHISCQCFVYSLIISTYELSIS